MSESFEAVYENGAFRPLEPMEFVDGVRVRLTISPPTGPLSEKEVEASMRMAAKVYEGLSDEEIDEIEKLILFNRYRSFPAPASQEPHS